MPSKEDPLPSDYSVINFTWTFGLWQRKLLCKIATNDIRSWTARYIQLEEGGKLGTIINTLLSFELANVLPKYVYF